MNSYIPHNVSTYISYIKVVHVFLQRISVINIFGLNVSLFVLAGIVAFDMEYGIWVEDQEKKNRELRNVLQAHITDAELHIYVDSGLKHFNDLFRMKADAAKVDVFYLMSGMWRTPVERFFLWLGGFRPSEILKVSMKIREFSIDQMFHHFK